MPNKFICAAFAATLLSSTAALAMGGASSGSGTPAPRSNSSSSSGKISPEVGKPLNDAIAAIKINDYKTALTHVQEAQAVPNRTPFEDYRINQILTNVAFSLQDMAMADQAAEAAADSPALPSEDKAGILKNAVLLSAQQKHWQKTLGYAQQLESMNALDDSTTADYAVALYETGEQAKALQYAQKSLDMSKAAGKAPDQAAQQIVMNSQAKANPAAAEQMLENMVLQSNSPDEWGRLIDYNFSAQGMNDVYAMDLYRLKFVTKSLKGDDASLAGRLANTLGYFGDAVAIMQAGGVSNADLAKARSNAARDQASMTSQIASGKSASGEVAVKVGEGLYGYGRFAEAEDLARAAMSKGHTKNPAEAPLLVGMAQVGEGKYADAVASFKGVSGNTAATKTAQLWAIYAQHMAGGAAPAPAAGAQPQQ